MKKNFLRFLCLTALCMSSSAVFASPCENLDGNADWTAKLNTMSSDIKNAQYDKALATANELNSVCPQSPMLNYLIAMAYRGKNNNVKEVYHLQQATRYANAFDVNLELLERMWTDRIFAENPDSKPENIQKDKETIRTLGNDLKAVQLKMDSVSETSTGDSLAVYESLMWTGTGVGIAGIAMTIAGGVLVGTMDNPIKSADNNKVKIDGRYSAGWGVLGAGIVMTVVGAVAAGVGGAFYADIKNSHDDVISWHVSPTGIGFSAAF